MIDTIFAAASPIAKSSTCITRISGPDAKNVLDFFSITEKIEPRRATVCRLKRKNKVFDEAILIWFPAPYSFTGENVMEIQSHGSYIVINIIHNELSRRGFRLANPGEFCYRSLKNKKISISQAEGLVALFSAETEMQANAAMEIMKGSEEILINEWIDSVTKISSIIEAIINFPEDIEKQSTKEIALLIENLVKSISSELKKITLTNKILKGWKVSIVGEPNVGKSSLSNALIGMNKSIVSNKPGTTRDIIENALSLDGQKVCICDLAGIRSKTEDEVESIGIERSINTIKSSDLIVLIDEKQKLDINILKLMDEFSSDMIIKVVSKGDLLSQNEKEKYKNLGYLIVSSFNDDGSIIRLKEEIIDRISKLTAKENETYSINLSAKKIGVIKTVLELLQEALAFISHEDYLEIGAELIKKVRSEICSLLNQESKSEDIIKAILSDMCIGK